VEAIFLQLTKRPQRTDLRTLFKKALQGWVFLTVRSGRFAGRITTLVIRSGASVRVLLLGVDARTLCRFFTKNGGAE
jgi:hypothetical protein